MRRVLVCGGRDFADRQFLFDVLDYIRAEWTVAVLILGGARGVDTLAEQWGKDRGIPRLVFTADWKMHGRAAGPIRNQAMLDYGKPDLVVAFPGGKGTDHMCRISRESGIPVLRYQRDR